MATQESSAALAAAERRWARRKVGGAMVMIVHPDLPMPIPAVLADTSSTGARLRVEVTKDNILGGRVRLPTSFTLQSRADKLEVDCKTVWRRSAELGVKYLCAPRPLQRTK